MPLFFRRRIVALGARAFLPTGIAGLQLWLDANDAATLFQDAAKTIPADDGDVVGAWADKSGNGLDATQTTTAAKPTLQFNIVNGKPVIRFDGTDDGLDAGDFSSLTGGEAFIVVKVDADPPPNNFKTGLWDFGASVAATHFPFNVDSTIYDTFGTTARKTTVNPATTLTQFNIYNVTSIANEWTSRLNNTELFTTAINTAGYSATAHLGISSTASAILDGDIAEMILYNAKLIDANRALVNNYLSKKSGIALS